MNKNNIIKHALANSLLTAFYVTLVVTFLNYAKTLFGDNEGPLIPMAMLMLLVFSASLCGFLVFGRPILWYLDGKKKEALSLFAYTVSILFVVTLAVFTTLYFVNL